MTNCPHCAKELDAEFLVDAFMQMPIEEIGDDDLPSDMRNQANELYNNFERDLKDIWGIHEPQGETTHPMALGFAKEYANAESLSQEYATTVIPALKRDLSRFEWSPEAMAYVEKPKSQSCLMGCFQINREYIFTPMKPKAVCESPGAVINNICGHCYHCVACHVEKVQK